MNTFVCIWKDGRFKVCTDIDLIRYATDPSYLVSIAIKGLVAAAEKMEKPFRKTYTERYDGSIIINPPL